MIFKIGLAGRVMRDISVVTFRLRLIDYVIVVGCRQ